MDESRKHCVICSFHGDGHFSSCIVPFREEATRILDRLKVDPYFRGHDPELIAFVKKVAGIYR